MMEGFQLVPKDKDGNNPYLRVNVGKTKIKDVDNVKHKTSRPPFFKCYEMPVNFPGLTFDQFIIVFFSLLFILCLTFVDLLPVTSFSSLVCSDYIS